MRGKRARQIRKLVGCDLGRNTPHKEQGFEDVGEKFIGVISHDGNHSIREDSVFEVRTTEERYLYRQLKLVYKGKLKDESIRTTLMEDLKSQPKVV